MKTDCWPSCAYYDDCGGSPHRFGSENAIGCPRFVRREHYEAVREKACRKCGKTTVYADSEVGTREPMIGLHVHCTSCGHWDFRYMKNRNIRQARKGV